MMDAHIKNQRELLSIHDVPRVGLNTYNASDPDTKLSPIERSRPPESAPNVLINSENLKEEKHA